MITDLIVNVEPTWGECGCLFGGHASETRMETAFGLYNLLVFHRNCEYLDCPLLATDY